MPSPSGCPELVCSTRRRYTVRWEFTFFGAPGRGVCVRSEVVGPTTWCLKSFLPITGILLLATGAVRDRLRSVTRCGGLFLVRVRGLTPVRCGGRYQVRVRGLQVWWAVLGMRSRPDTGRVRWAIPSSGSRPGSHMPEFDSSLTDIGHVPGAVGLAWFGSRPDSGRVRWAVP